jgi:hypothetical protein
LFVPYLLFNRVLAGEWWPNTFFAKQAEYAVIRQIPLWKRYLSQVSLPLIGVGVVLLPGFIYFLMISIRRRSWGNLAGGIWMLGYLFIYALRLPVTYQHGRYVIPAMPIYFLWSLAGLVTWVLPLSKTRWKRVFGSSWILSAAIVLLFFWFLGARAYAQDVAIIESEMVDTAHWIAEHTPTEALVAAHDIGALGYFGRRRLIDLAGLVSPEVIPFIRDEQRLESYLNEQEALYLVTFPDWYPYLVTKGRLEYRSMGSFSLEQGGENMSVYEWNPH